MCRAISAPSVSAVTSRATVRPSRRTVTLSLSSSTSPSLWVTMTTVRPGVAQAAQHVEEQPGLLRRQHRGRLVEDQHLGVAVQRLEDLHPLEDADREVADPRPRIDPRGRTARTGPAPRGRRPGGRAARPCRGSRPGRRRSRPPSSTGTAGTPGAPCPSRPRRRRPASGSGPPGRRPGSPPRRARSGRRAPTSGWTCPRRSRRRARGSPRWPAAGRRRRSRRRRRTAWRSRPARPGAGPPDRPADPAAAERISLPRGHPRSPRRPRSGRAPTRPRR